MHPAFSVFPALLALALCLPAAAQEPPLPTLTVNGSGEVSARPDLAHVRLGAQAQEPEAGAAQDNVNRTMQGVLDALKASGIPAENIRTTGLSLEAVYADQRPGDTGEPRLTGYRAANSVEVELPEVSRIPTVIDTAMKAGANRLEGVSFSLKDDQAQREKALRKAIADARSKAGIMAADLGVRLSLIHEVQERGVQVLPRRRAESLARAGAAFAATPVEPGEIQVRADVSITYRLDQSGTASSPEGRAGPAAADKAPRAAISR